jgi:hypothetical protein
MGKYHNVIHNIQELVDNISSDSGINKVLSRGVEEYVSTILDEILDSNPDIFGETNHMSYFYENHLGYEVIFENIGKVQIYTFRCGKVDINLEKELVRSLWEVYTCSADAEDRSISKNDANHFANIMKSYFDVFEVPVLTN